MNFENLNEAIRRNRNRIYQENYREKIKNQEKFFEKEINRLENENISLKHHIYQFKKKGVKDKM